VIVKNGTINTWEKGINRIGDFEILTEVTGGFVNGMDKGNNYQSESAHNRVKKVEIRDEWESYTISYTIFNTKEAGTDEMVLQENE